MNPFITNDSRLQRNFCACGFAATGDNEPPIPQGSQEPEQQLEPVKSQVMNLQSWHYVKSILAIIGIYVVGKFIYTKIIKK